MAPPHQYPCLEIPTDTGIWEAIVHSVTVGTTYRESSSKRINASLCSVPESNATLNINYVSIKINLKKKIGMTKPFTLPRVKGLGFLSLWMRISKYWRWCRIHCEMLWGQRRWCEGLSWEWWWSLGNPTVNEWARSHNTCVMINDITEDVSGTGHTAYNLLRLKELWTCNLVSLNIRPHTRLLTASFTTW